MYTRQQALLESSNPVHRKLGEITLVAEDYMPYGEYLQQRVLGAKIVSKDPAYEMQKL